MPSGCGVMAAWIRQLRRKKKVKGEVYPPLKGDLPWRARSKAAVEGSHPPDYDRISFGLLCAAYAQQWTHLPKNWRNGIKALTDDFSFGPSGPRSSGVVARRKRAVLKVLDSLPQILSSPRQDHRILAPALATVILFFMFPEWAWQYLHEDNHPPSHVIPVWQTELPAEADGGVAGMNAGPAKHVLKPSTYYAWIRHDQNQAEIQKEAHPNTYSEPQATGTATVRPPSPNLKYLFLLPQARLEEYLGCSNIWVAA